MDILRDIEEPGDEKCPMHLYTYYRENGQDRYRECHKCWIKHKKTQGVWKEMWAWTDWRH